MNQLNIINDLGNDANLLTKTDMWLETQRIDLAQRFSQLAQELKTILNAQRIKRQLQQSNHVAVQFPENGIPDVGIYILPLPDAVKELQKGNDGRQLNKLQLDGYDVETASELR